MEELPPTVVEAVRAQTEAHAAEVAARVAERTADIEQSIRYRNEANDRDRARIADLPARIAELYAVRARLTAAGFEPRLLSWSDTIQVNTTEDRLLDLARVVGTLELQGKCLEDSDPKKRNRNVVVTRTARRFPFVTVSYVTRLRDDVKCKIVRVKNVKRELVCNL